MNFTELPEEIQNDILSKCKAETILNMSEISRKYRYLCMEEGNYIWKELVSKFINIDKYKDIQHFNKENNTEVYRWMDIYKYMYGIRIDMESLEKETELGHIHFVKYILQHKKLGGIRCCVSIHESNIQGQLDKLLYWASYYNNLDIVKYALEAGANINSEYHSGLEGACEKGNFEMVKYLIQHGADPNVQTASECEPNNTPLMMASRNGDIEIAQYLVEHGADIHVTDDVVILACASGNLELVKYYDRLGLNIYREEDTCLCAACKYGHLDIVKYLVEHGADVNSEEVYIDFDLGTPIWYACGSGNYDVVKYLVSRGAILDSSLDLMLNASRAGNVDVVKFLIDNNIQFDRDECFNASVQTLNPNIDMIEYLLQYYLNTDGTFDIRNEEALEYTYTHGHLNLFKYLVERGIYINIDYDRLLMNVCEYEYLDIVKYLVEKGSNIHIDNEGPLINACKHGHLHIVEYLVGRGANIHIDDEMPLVKACEGGKLEIIKYLIRHGADIHVGINRPIKVMIKGKYYETVKIHARQRAYSHHYQIIENACKLDNSDVVRFLIKKGANRQIALMYAFDYGNLEAIEYLRSLGTNIYDDNGDGILNLFYKQ